MLTPSRHIGFHSRHFSTAPSHCLLGLLLKSKDEIKTHVLSEKRNWISFMENLKTGATNFIALRDFWMCTKEQKTPLSHTCFFYLYIVYFPINFLFVTSHTEGLFADPRTSRNQRTPSVIQGISKMYGLCSMYVFYEIRKFSAFYFTWVVLRKKRIWQEVV